MLISEEGGIFYYYSDQSGRAYFVLGIRSADQSGKGYFCISSRAGTISKI